MAQPRRDPIPAPPRRRYPIGALQPAALARGRQIVAERGVEALTLRGLARDLGVSAPALLYYFGSRAGLRAAVAAEVQEELARLVDRPPIGRAHAALPDAGARWIAFAERNPNLYRLAFGDGWRSPGFGWRPGASSLPLPTNQVEYKLRRCFDRDLRAGHLPEGTAPTLARHVAAGFHGLATARVDGADESSVAASLTMLLAAVPRSPQPWMNG